MVCGVMVWIPTAMLTHHTVVLVPRSRWKTATLQPADLAVVIVALTAMAIFTIFNAILFFQHGEARSFWHGMFALAVLISSS